MHNQTKNTRERVYEILEKFGFDFSPVAVLPQRRKLITSRQVDAISSAVDRIDDIITTHQKQAIEEAMAKFGIKKGVAYDVKASDKVIVLTAKETNQ